MPALSRGGANRALGFDPKIYRSDTFRGPLWDLSVIVSGLLFGIIPLVFHAQFLHLFTLIIL
jgi:hypothetical protein